MSDSPPANGAKIRRRALLLGLPAIGLVDATLGCSGTGQGTQASADPTTTSTSDPTSTSDTAGTSDTTSSSDLPTDDPTLCEATQRDARGPFYEEGAPPRMSIAEPDEPGERTLIRGVVFGPDCATPLADAEIDVWHADATGTYHDAETDYRLRGKVTTDSEGRYSFESIRPGNYDMRPAHYHLTVRRGGYAQITTQIYFSGDPYLGPGDSCQLPTCDSGDPRRILDVEAEEIDGKTLLVGEFDIILAEA